MQSPLLLHGGMPGVESSGNGFNLKGAYFPGNNLAPSLILSPRQGGQEGMGWGRRLEAGTPLKMPQRGVVAQR